MSETNQTQSLATLPPPVTPVVVLNDLTLTKLVNLEKCLNDPVTNQKEADSAAHNRKVAAALASELDEGREKMKKPYLEAGRVIDATFKPYIARAELAKETLRVKLSEFEVAKRKQQEEEERLARLESDRIRREAEEAAAAAAAAQRALDEQRRKEEQAAAAAGLASAPKPALAAADDFDPDADAEEEERERLRAEAARLNEEAQKKAQAAMVAPVVVMQPKTAGVSMSVRLEPEVVDIHQVPNEFVKKELKLAELKKACCSGWQKGDPIPVVAGIKFKVVEGVR